MSSPMAAAKSKRLFVNGMSAFRSDYSTVCQEEVAEKERAEVHVSDNDHLLYRNVDPNLRSRTRPISHKGMHIPSV